MTYLLVVVFLTVYTVFVYRLGVASERTKQYEKCFSAVANACNVRNTADVDKLREKYRNK